MTEPLLAIEPAPPAAPLVETKLTGVLVAMAEAVSTLLDTADVDRFGRAARLCVMGQKISSELVKTIKEAKKVRALDHDALARAGLMGAEGQYIAQGAGDINGYAEDMADEDILQGGNGVLAMPRMHGGAFMGDQTQLTRDMMMMLQGWFEDQKKSKAAKAEVPPQRLDLYDELNQAFAAVRSLKDQDPQSPHLAVLNQQIDKLMAKIAEGAAHDSPAAAHVVPAELLRRHPPGAGEQWGDEADPRRPVLHREGGGEGADRGGEALRDLEEAVG